jgi:predicted permease
MAESKGIRRAFRSLLRKSDVERAVTEEMEFHLDMAAQQIVEREGLSPEKARSEAKRRFGDQIRYRLECVDMEDRWRRRRAVGDWIHDLRMDARFGIRQLRKTLGLTVAIILCLSIGIGANTAVFNIARYTLFPDTVIRDPDSVVRLFTYLPSGLDYASVSWPDYVDIRDRATSFESVAAGAYQPFHLADDGMPERAWGAIATWNYFSTLGIGMTIGRDFLPEEGVTPGTHPVMIISWSLWQRRYGGDPGVIGREVVLNDYPFTIVGVADRSFRSGMVGIRCDLWVPMMMWQQAQPSMDSIDIRDSHWLMPVVGRLRPGVTVEQAREEVNVLMAQLAETYPESNAGVLGRVVSERGSRFHPLIRDSFENLVVLLGIVVGLILLLTCANVAGLMLARAAARRREIGIRLAIGADRGRVIRQVLTESMLLAAVAGVVGLLLAQGTGPLLQSAMPAIDLPLDLSLGFYPEALAFSAFIALIAGAVFGAGPALEVSRQDLVTALTTGRATPERRVHRSRRLLVGAQVAVSLVLLITSGLVLRSMKNASNIDIGFDPENLVLANLFLEMQAYDIEQSRAFYEAVDERIRRLPGVEALTIAQGPQLTPTINSTQLVPEGWDQPEENIPPILYNYVDEHYFDTLRIPVQSGRVFTSNDDVEAERVVVVNQAMADHFWPDQDPIGKQVRRWSGQMLTVIGVVPTGKYFSLGEAPRLYAYFALRQSFQTTLSLHIRTAGAPEPIQESIRQVIHDVDPNLPVAELTSAESYLGFALLPARALAWLVSAFAGLALLLATVGLYGLMSYSVNQRTQEIGIRIALGARGSDVVRSVTGRAMTLVLVALGIGLVLGLMVSSAITNILYGLSPVEPVTSGLAVVALVVVALVASLLPAMRAARVNPVEALSSE